ncbi:MAG TPA: N-acyl homoserine lactonase family protein [Acidimicrobiales bacterium]
MVLSRDDVVPLHLADLTFPDWHPLHGETGAVLAFALRHPTGLLLFETGIGTGNQLIDDAYQVQQRAIDAALAAHGHDINEVRLIINSHLHFDHCGNNYRFPGVPIYVQASELDATRAPHYTVSEWVDFEGAEYAVIDGDAQVASGVRILSTPGHSPGHQSVVFDTAAGAVVLAGQAIYSKAEYEHLQATNTVCETDPSPDLDQYLASAARLMKLQPHRVHFSHDMAVWKR